MIKICIFSGKRGGFGAFIPLMKLIEDDSDLELQILLGDMHASKEFGSTVNEARKFFPKAKLEVIKMGTGRGDTPVIRTENLGICLKESASILDRLKPDIVIVHADRAEHNIIALAALNLNIPIAHTQGGEVSGNIDDILRHSISKLAHLHFPETREAADRIKRLGEDAWRIHPVGSIYIDRIVKKYYPSNIETRKKYNLELGEKYFITIFHPDTFESPETNYSHMKNIIDAIKRVGKKSFILYPCSDPGYESVVRAINEKANDQQFLIYKNIENLDFLSLMSDAAALIGNSSCALKEAPYFQLPAINIGKRQMGREREGNVVDSDPTTKDILKAIEFISSNSGFLSKLSECGYMLGDGKASERIVGVIKNTKIDNKLLRKRME